MIVALLLTTPFAAGGVTWPDGSPKVDIGRERIYGPDRYATAVATAKEAFPGWAGVDHVVIASGEDRSAVDPLAASSLCWAYDAPLLLTESHRLTQSVKTALKEIVSANTTVTVTIVGGTKAVPAARERDIAAIVGEGMVARPWPTGDRYDVAAGIAHAVAAVAQATSRTVPPVAFVANGDDPGKFVDALSLSGVSANTGIPILLTAKNLAPEATVTALESLAPTETIVAGGTSTITSAIRIALGGDTRWAGRDRYETSAVVAREATARGWIDPSTICVAAKVPDAVVAGALARKLGGPVIISAPSTLNISTARFIADDTMGVTAAKVLGGTAAVSSAVYNELAGKPSVPKLTTFKNVVTKKAPIKVSSGVNTTQVKLYVAGKLHSTKTVKAFTVTDFGNVWLAEGTTEIKLVASNPDGETSTLTRKVTRLDYPASTSIVIDKSQFKLYWIKNDVLIKVYPIAHGKVGWSTPERTWKINAKYYSSGVYGPRKMRLFSKTSSGWSFSPYLIHGTNQEWVIGTRASHGCIRMYNKDVLELYPQVPLGTIVVTRP